MTSLSQRISEACDCEAGMSRQELIKAVGEKFTRIDSCLPFCVETGRVFKVDVRGNLMRYFRHEEHANAWRATLVPVPCTSDQIRALFKANPENGYSGNMLMSVIKYANNSTVCKELRTLAESGELFRGINHQMGSRYFSRPDLAREYEKARNFSTKQKPEKVKHVRAAVAKSIKKEVYRPDKDTREVITPAHVVVQKGPCAEVFSPYQLTSKDKVPKLFRKLPLGATLYGMTA